MQPSTPGNYPKLISVERVSLGQLFSSGALFVLGTTWLVVPGADLGRDAWIGALLGLLSGVPLVLLYNRIASLFPGETPAEWLPRVCGKFLGRLICLIYVVYFLYIAARNVRDIAELLHLSFLVRTPLTVITLTQGMAVGLAAYFGVETSGRVKQILFPVVMLLFAIVLIGLFPNRYPLHLYPMLEYGFPAVWHWSFPGVTTIPYGELVVMIFYIPFVRGRPLKSFLGATLLGGGILVATTFLAVLVLGPANLAAAGLPFYTLVRGISMGGLFQRLDAIIVPMIAFCAYVKAAKLMLAASYSLARLQGASRPGRLALPLGLLIGGWGASMASSLAEHLELGLERVPYALHIPLQILLPLLLWLLAEWRNRHRPQKGHAKEVMALPTRWFQIVVLIIAIVSWYFALNPKWREGTHVANRAMRSVGHVVGEPIVRLLGGRPMRD